MSCKISAVIALIVAAPAANAATVYLDEALFTAAVTGNLETSEFTGQPQGAITNGAQFDNGVTVTLDQPSSDNFVEDTFLRLSIDNIGPDAQVSAVTETVTFAFDVPVTAFGFEFGDPVTAPDGGTGRGPGNNSGTTLTAGDFSFSFSDDYSANPGYTGFFGVVGHPGDTFSSVVFSSNGIGDFVDDDFTVQSIALAPVPLPAGLPLLAAGLGVLGLLRRRSKA